MPAWLALSGAVLIGMMTAAQARINGELGLRLGDGLLAAAISFGSGLARSWPSQAAQRPAVAST